MCCGLLARTSCGRGPLSCTVVKGSKKSKGPKGPKRSMKSMKSRVVGWPSSAVQLWGTGLALAHRLLMAGRAGRNVLWSACENVLRPGAAILHGGEGIKEIKGTKEVKEFRPVKEPSLTFSLWSTNSRWLNGTPPLESGDSVRTSARSVNTHQNSDPRYRRERPPRGRGNSVWSGV